MPLLDVRGLDVSYGPVQILFDVDLAVVDGEALALLGTNGAGKSTLLKAVSGVVTVGGGEIHFDGKDITRAYTQERVAAGLVQLAGGKAVFPTPTLEEKPRAGASPLLRNPVTLARRPVAGLELLSAVAERK